MIESCISAFLERKEKRVYEDYIAECMRIITKNTAFANQSADKEYITVRYRDIVERPKAKEKPKSADEIISRIKAKMEKLTGGGEDNGDSGIRGSGEAGA